MARLVAESRDPSNHGSPTSAGLPRLREALAAWYERRCGVRLDPATQAPVTWRSSEPWRICPGFWSEPATRRLCPTPATHVRFALVQSEESIGRALEGIARALDRPIDPASVVGPG